MTNLDGARAWQFLKRNPTYVEAWQNAGPPGANEPAPFPLRAQSEADCGAEDWGLLAWEEPMAEGGPSSPFWAEAPTLDAMSAPEGPALLELLAAPGARLSGLRLRNGAVMIKAERGNAALQLLIADGDSFDPEGGVVLRLPVALDLQVRLRRTADLWPIGTPARKSETERT